MDIRTLQSALARLAEERADDPLQAPKNVAVSLGAEAGIVLSLFRGLAERQGLEDDVSREIAAEALTSILVQVAQLANHVGLDASAGLRARIKGRPSPPLSPPNTVPVVIPRSSDAAGRPEAKAGVEAVPAPAAVPAKSGAPKPEPSTAAPPAPESVAGEPGKVDGPKVDGAKGEIARAAPANAEPKTAPAEPESGAAAPATAKPADAEPETNQGAATARTESAGKGGARKRGGSGVVGVKVEAPPKPAPAPAAAAAEVIDVDEPAPAPAARPSAPSAQEPYHTLDTDTVLEFTKAMSRELDRSTRDDPVLRELRDEIETLRRSLYASNTKKAWIAGSLRSVRGHLEETLSYSFAESLRSEHFMGRIDALLND